MNFWTLDDDHNVRAVSEDDFVAFILDNHANFETRFRVARTQIDGDCWVSTVFLFAYPWFGGEPPRLFESMVFGGDDLDRMIRRYATWDEALAGHQEVVDGVMARRI